MAPRNNLLYLPVAVLLILTASALWAQTPTIVPETPESIPEQIILSPAPDGFDRVDRLMRLGAYDRAADLLETLVEQHPEMPALREMLGNCYEMAKDYGRLLLFLTQRAQTEPPSFALFRDLARAYFLSGKPDSATAAIYQAASLARSPDIGLRVLADIFHQFGQYQAEAGFIDSMRTLTRDDRLLAIQMGDALAAQQQFSRATLEYLAHMENDSIAAREGEDKLIDLMRFPGSADTVMSVLGDRMRARAENKRLLSIYGQLLIEQGKLDEAFTFFRGLDSLEGGLGGSLLFFMQQCNERHQYAQAIRAGEYLLQNYAQSSLNNSVRFELTDALTATGRYQEALTTYQRIAEDVTRPAHRAEADLKIGLLYKDHLGDLGRAKEYFTTVTQIVPGGRFDTDARLALADVAVRERRFDSAAALYNELLGRELPDEMLEEIDYALAELDLFRQDYQNSGNRFRQIISRYPKGFYVNDAIQYSLILTETLDQAPKQIDLFAAAEYFRHTKQNDSLEYYLTKICRVGIPSLAPVSYLYLARMYFDQQRLDQAVASADSLISLYPDSYYLPFGLKLKADVFLLSAHTKDQALVIYHTLLEQYGFYPFAAEIRDIIRREAPGGRS